MLVAVALLFTVSAAADPQPACGVWTADTVNLRSCWITDSDLPALTRRSGLKRLDLSMIRITDQGLLQLKPLSGLEDLNLRYAELITDEGMSAVKGWKQLRRIDLRGTRITDTTLGYLGALTSLESIDAGFAQISDNGIELLTTLPGLRRLTLGGNKLTDTGLQALRLMPSLEYLDLSGSQRTDSGLWSVSITERGVAAISSVSKLRELRVGGSNVTALSLEQLRSGLRGLERLSLQRCKRIRDESVDILSEWPALVEIDIQDTGITPEGARRLRLALPKAVVRY